ncbi:spore germination protein [Paenibacillus sp. TRM 82003]|nr:spore germination protein [Paenibacillus sp. TRM 82003]
MPEMEINIVNFKVYRVSGTSSINVGRAVMTDLSSHSKTTNGVGNAYGDGSNIEMSPSHSSVNDSDIVDAVIQRLKNEPSPPPQIQTAAVQYVSVPVVYYYPYYYPVYWGGG